MLLRLYIRKNDDEGKECVRASMSCAEEIEASRFLEARRQENVDSTCRLLKACPATHKGRSEEKSKAA